MRWEERKCPIYDTLYATIRKIEFRDRDTTEDEMDEIRAEVNAKSMMTQFR